MIAMCVQALDQEMHSSSAKMLLDVLMPVNQRFAENARAI